MPKDVVWTMRISTETRERLRREQERRASMAGVESIPLQACVIALISERLDQVEAGR